MSAHIVQRSARCLRPPVLCSARVSDPLFSVRRGSPTPCSLFGAGLRPPVLCSARVSDPLFSVRRGSPTPPKRLTSVRRGSPTPPKRLTGGLPSALLRSTPSLLARTHHNQLDRDRRSLPRYGWPTGCGSTGRILVCRRSPATRCRLESINRRLVTPYGARPRTARGWLAAYALPVHPSGSVLCCWSIAMFLLPTICPREQAGTNGAPVGTR
jgi:hypothetical protein